MAAVDIGTGTTVSFATSLFSAQVLAVRGPNLTRGSVDTTHMGSTLPSSTELGGRTHIPVKLPDMGELELDIHFNPDTWPPIRGAAEVIRLTFPIPSGLSNGAYIQGSGFVISFDSAVPLEDKMTGTLRVKCSGVWVPTAAS